MSETCVIAGGTKGLGRALAEESLKNGVRPIIIGRSAAPNDQDQIWHGQQQVKMDLSRPQPEPVKRLAADCTDKLLWVAGTFLRKPFTAVTPPEFWDLVCLHQWGYFRFLQIWHQARLSMNRTYHLITIASTSSWRVRDDEDLYCMAKAAKAALTRNLARRIVRDLPGSKILLVNPGGFKSELYAGTGQDISGFMEPRAVAADIWWMINQQTEPYREWHIMRDPSGQPKLLAGQIAPEPAI